MKVNWIAEIFWLGVNAAITAFISKLTGTDLSKVFEIWLPLYAAVRLWKLHKEGQMDGTGFNIQLSSITPKVRSVAYIISLVYALVFIGSHIGIGGTSTSGPTDAVELNALAINQGDGTLCGGQMPAGSFRLLEGPCSASGDISTQGSDGKFHFRGVSVSDIGTGLLPTDHSRWVYAPFGANASLEDPIDVEKSMKATGCLYNSGGLACRLVLWVN